MYISHRVKVCRSSIASPHFSTSGERKRRGETRRANLQTIYFRRIERSGANLLWRKCGARGGRKSLELSLRQKILALDHCTRRGELFSRKSNSLDGVPSSGGDDHLRGGRSLRFERQRDLVRAFKPTDETIGEGEEGVRRTTRRPEAK